MVRARGADLYRSFAYDVAPGLLDLKSRGSFDRSVSSTRDVEPNPVGGRERRMTGGDPELNSGHVHSYADATTFAYDLQICITKPRCPFPFRWSCYR